MAEPKRTYEVDAGGALSLTLAPRAPSQPARQVRELRVGPEMELAREETPQRRQTPSRDLVARLIEWFEHD